MEDAKLNCSLELDKQALALPVLAYRDIVPDLQDDALGLEAAFCGGSEGLHG